MLDKGPDAKVLPARIEKALADEQLFPKTSEGQYWREKLRRTWEELCWETEEPLGELVREQQDEVGRCVAAYWALLIGEDLAEYATELKQHRPAFNEVGFEIDAVSEGLVEVGGVTASSAHKAADALIRRIVCIAAHASETGCEPLALTPYDAWFDVPRIEPQTVAENWPAVRSALLKLVPFTWKDAEQLWARVDKEAALAWQRRQDVEADSGPPAYVTLEEAARICYTPKKTLEDWKQKGELPPATVHHAGRRPDRWDWDVLRPALERKTGLSLPKRPPECPPR